MTDNELIAEFMGLSFMSDPETAPFAHLDGLSRGTIYAAYGNRDHYKLVRDMEYDKSWDWLMPVVERIEEIEEPHPSNNPERGTIWPYQFEILSRNVVQIIDNTTDGSIVTINQDGISKIQAVYKAVVEFIKWYNQAPGPTEKDYEARHLPE